MLNRLFFNKIRSSRSNYCFIQPILILLIISMSHLRDIQRLRQTRNLDSLTTPMRVTQNKPVDIYNIIFDRLQPEPRSNPITQFARQPNSKQSVSTSTASRERRVSHRRGSSNATNEPQSPGLSVYNFALKLNHKGSTTTTARRQKNLSTNQFQYQQVQFPSSSRIPRSYPIEVGLNSFDAVCVVGKGGFGKVWKVEMKKTRQIYAMKEMYKAKIIAKKSINSVMNQRTLLARIRHPFFINISYAFQDRENLYLIMDYVNGGDLRYHIGRRRKFTQTQTKFFIANLIVGLQYLHRNRIIHRDIKPQNLVFDSQGYLRITDLGVSRQWKQENYQDTSGTPGYMAPEVMCRKNHSFTADYFAVGVMAYEFMLGRRPYIGKSRKEIRDQILSKQATVKLDELPNRWSLDAVHFINQLLQRNPNNRLGAGGIQELKRHDWMKGIDFIRVEKKEAKAPYIPVSIEENYQDYKEQISEDSVQDNCQENMLMLRDEQVQSLFEGYEYDPSLQKMERKKSNTYISN